MSEVYSKYELDELYRFLDGPRLIDGSDLNHNFELLFYPSPFNIPTITPADSPYYVRPTDTVLLCDTTDGNITILLPDARDVFQKTLAVKKNDLSANEVIVTPVLGDTVDLQYTHASPYLLTNALQAVILVSDFVSNWPIIATANISMPVVGKTINITAEDSPYTASSGDTLIVCDTTDGAITVTLALASDATFQEVTVFNKTGTNFVTVNPQSGDSILGQTVLINENQAQTYQPDGTLWLAT